ncbi:DUF1254 domain-containing protein [Leucobacter luti]|uniref:DUF1254 domain-containing protein n=1 Tax=Leucobacter luti TaxID=340320 RepID=A0A4Q7U5H3_9MICO|nr:DUF1254 domain-containing protein [Leucobacter luti]MBL3700766.1 DUF1254 domain-containing protein [Leucobacter luti]RZT68397.1 hypothetical protein EV139_0120 [Leucobacter luti]
MSAAPQDLTTAYLYGFPLVFNLDQVARYVSTGVGKNPAAPWNAFSHARTLAGPEDKFVTINNDTVYSMAQLDMSVGPILLRVPATHGRYFVLQFVNAWTDNFAYIGHRATGSDAGEYLLVPSDWGGAAPAGATVVRVPTRVASIVGRWAVDGDADLAAVHALQDATTLTPQDPGAAPLGLPAAESASGATATEAGEFWAKYRLWSREFPPAPRDEALLAGTLAALDASDEAGRDSGYAAGKAALEHILTSGAGNALVNGWNLAYHSFDYNLDYFEVGSIDDPAFKITDPQRRIVQRAGAALGGLWGNQAFEAAYIATYVDDQGEPLDGRNSYTLHLAPTPPVGAFWSLTMYDVPDYYLVPNPAGRFSIGDRTPGLEYEADGSLVITMSHAEPADPRARANWLPAPAGAFRPVLRMYEPAPEVLDQSYTVAAITRQR